MLLQFVGAVVVYAVFQRVSLLHVTDGKCRLLCLVYVSQCLEVLLQDISHAHAACHLCALLQRVHRLVALTHLQIEVAQLLHVDAHRHVLGLTCHHLVRLYVSLLGIGVVTHGGIDIGHL